MHLRNNNIEKGSDTLIKAAKSSVRKEKKEERDMGSYALIKAAQSWVLPEQK
jgi:hypothetical protein